VIISASRRTDIPAFYSRWLMQRIRAGFCLVANPFRPSQVVRVSLLPEDVTAMVFWSKNPQPLLGQLDELDRLGYCYYFLMTLNDYPTELEPNLPGLKDRIRTFIELSDKLGPKFVVWRYDPVVISNLTPAQYHETRFEKLCRALSGRTERAVVSVVDFYRKTDRRLSELENRGVIVNRYTAGQPEMLALLTRLNQIASAYGIELCSCAEEPALSAAGVKPGSCIDGVLVQKLCPQVAAPRHVFALGDSILAGKDPGQRARCRCVLSKDIGANDTCLHGCRYCYATRSDALARRRYNEHDPESPILWSKPKSTY
jgi:hypothetical protein